jgi:CheY-like chemotaxis protein
MVVDDDKEFIQELCEGLSMVGYDPVALKDGDKVLALARVVLPEVIILDLRMKKKSGFEVISDLKGDPALCHIPVIGMSGDYQEGSLGIFKVYGFCNFLKKPFSIQELAVVIDDVLGLSMLPT